MKTNSRQPANPDITYNPVEITGVFQRVVGVSGVGGNTGLQPDPWRAKIPPRVPPTPAPVWIKSSHAPEVPVGFPPESPTACDFPTLVPLDSPFVEGRRYRMAGATDALTRLDLYIADPAGLWVRTAGVLMAVLPTP